MQASFAADQVLLLAIGDYPTQPLVGVHLDVQSALTLVQKLGYDTSQATVLKNQQLTHAGLQQALADLKQRTRKNDRVFIYYSGHGTSVKSNGQCTQALVPIDATLRGENLFTVSELTRALDEVKSLTSDAMVVIDACYSGGLREIASRGKGQAVASGKVRAKSWTPSGGEICHEPLNITKQWGVPEIATRSMNAPENNVVFIAAANEREVALDDADLGGLATHALLQCATSGVQDTDGSQGISAQELAACAQSRIVLDVQKINREEGREAYKPQRVEVYGNADRNLSVPMLSDTKTKPDRARQTLAAFKQIAAGSNGNWQVKVGTSASEVKLGGNVTFNYSTMQPGYVSALYVGSDHKDIQALLVNKAVTASTNGTLGTTNISKPAGVNTFLVLFSQVPLDLDAVLRDGKAALSPQALQNIQCATAMGSNRNASKFASEGPCAGQSRNASKFAAAAPDTVAGYAARVLTVKGR